MSDYLPFSFLVQYSALWALLNLKLNEHNDQGS